MKLENSKSTSPTFSPTFIDATSPSLAPEVPSLTAEVPPTSVPQAQVIPSLTLGEVSYQAIRVQFDHTTKQRKAVLRDTDPEALHQMRVGFRRLRTTLKTFEAVVDLPKGGRDRALGNLSRRLGQVRDLDVLQVDLHRRTLPQLPLKEQKRLEDVLRLIKRDRNQQFQAMVVLLRSDRYRLFKSIYREWLKDPHYTALAELAWDIEAPDLLLSQFCRLFRHPGWLLGTEVTTQGLQGLPWSDSLREQVQRQSSCLHSLRKAIKEARYQGELFQTLYGDFYGQVLKDLKTAQGLLGQMQDLQVQQVTIADHIHQPLAQRFPSLVAQFEATQAHLWHQWHPLHQRYISPQFRSQLRHHLLEPSAHG
ncbi:CHAD domain-containing protein [Prochlorothrix hollandica]|uniref:CHAD domain-containing protein n=1 Tax=Prochlorothrix hollandica TaxID=1223 RepID=UPI00034A6D5F|nr:CHAD domain-containing protein [Prochlorothrix hollandica]